MNVRAIGPFQCQHAHFFGQAENAGENVLPVHRQNLPRGNSEASPQICFRKVFCSCNSRLCGVDCENVSGFCKGYDYHPGDEFASTKANHQWNCVKVDGTWMLVDCCWGAGFIEETSGDFIPSPRDLYCFVDPDVFILDHFPLDSRWQLLHSPIDIQIFEASAHVKYGYFLHKVQLCNHKHAVIRCEGKCSVQLSFPPSLDISCKLLDENSISHDGHVHYNLHEQHATVKCQLQSEGTFTLVIYGKNRQEPASSFKSIVSYRIDNLSGIESLENLDHGALEFVHWGPTRASYDVQLKQNLPVQTSLCSSDRKEPLRLNFTAENTHIQLKGDLYQLKGSSPTKLDNQTFTQRFPQGKRQLLVAIPNPGEYLLRVYARSNSNERFHLAGNYRIHGNATKNNVRMFPQMTVQWLGSNCELLPPWNGELKRNQTADLSLNVENAVNVILLLPGRKPVGLQRGRAQEWHKTFFVGNFAGKAQLFVQKANQKFFQKYLQFHIA